MGIYGKPCIIPVKKFKILLKSAQYIVYKINYIHTYGYLFRKSVDQKIMNFLTKNNNLSKIYKILLKNLEFTNIDSSKYKFSHDFPNLKQKYS